jgi:hypothetical protein
MKIDTELRHVIVATARANAKLPNGDRENKQKAVDALLATPKGKKMAKQVFALLAQEEALEERQRALRKKRHALQQPFGLEVNDRRNKTTGKQEHYFTLGWGDNEVAAFVRSGGVLPNPERRNWSADELLRLLANATTQEAFDALLKEYGINWS